MLKQLPYILAWAILFGSSFLQAQDRINEKELNLDQLYLDATKEKLLGNTEKAIEAFKIVLDNYPEHAPSAYELSRLYQSAKNSQEAIAMGKLAMESDEENKWYRMHLATLYSEASQNKEAAELFDKIIENDPSDQEHYFQKAFYYVKDSDLKNALKVYDQLEKRQGLSEDLVRRKHTLYFGMGNYKKAAEEYVRLKEAFPNTPEFYEQLASFYEQIDNRDAALEVYRELLQIDPDHPKASLVVAGGDAKNKDAVGYLAALKPVFEDPNVAIDLKIGKILPLVEQYKKSPDQELLQELVDLTDLLERVHADDGKSFAIAGDMLSLSQSYEQAIAKYKQALEIDDTIYSLWEQLLYTLQVTGQAKDLSSYAERALDVFPNQAEIYYNAAIGHLNLQDAEEAIYYLEQALLLSAQNQTLQQTVLSAIGMSYAQDGDFQEAKDAFDKARAIQPASAIAETRYAYTLALEGKKEEAKGILQKMEKMGSQQTLFVEAQALANGGQAGIDLLQRFQEQGGQLMPRTMELLGDFNFQIGNVDQAIDFWKKAQDAGIQSNSLKKKITDRKL